MKKSIFTACCLSMVLLGNSSVYADQVVFQPGSVQGKDMWLSSVYNNTAVDDDKLQVGGWGDWYRTLIQFDLTDLPPVATSVDMYMYAYDRGDSSTPVSMIWYFLMSSWDEQTQDYYDPLSGGYLGVLPAPTPNSWYGILNITTAYNWWKAGTYANYGFAFLATDNNNQFNVFRSSDYSDYRYRPKLVVTYDGANLGFPLSGYTPYNAPISAVLDHSMTTGGGCADGLVVAYTNERGSSQYDHSNWYVYGESLSCVNDILYGYKNGNPGTVFSINNQYDTSSGNEDGYYLFYDGHTGYDYPIANTNVYAAASGTVTVPSPNPYNQVNIDHGNGFVTYYLHLSQIYVSTNDYVTKGTSLIGKTSDHLHFTVKKNGQRVDPYGWQGEYGTDPLQVSGNDNVCLWDFCQ
ncbi:DNRLRE domain-containing protein [Patescibacteria group bacterium]|nr:DNRLRE domain-containing protein [Patescibacteria group bacterium]